MAPERSQEHGAKIQQPTDESHNGDSAIKQVYFILNPQKICNMALNVVDFPPGVPKLLLQDISQLGDQVECCLLGSTPTKPTKPSCYHDGVAAHSQFSILTL